MIETKADLKTAVLQQLNTGKDKAIPGKLLAQRLGERDTRHIRLSIQELIREGTPIIGNAQCGYFIADNPEDVKECLKQLRSYGLMLFSHYSHLKKAGKKKFSGQLSMKL